MIKTHPRSVLNKSMLNEIKASNPSDWMTSVTINRIDDMFKVLE